MPLEFPNSPANGALNQQFQYDASITAWRQQGSTQNVGTQIAKLQTASPITVANQAERDTLYPNPVQGNSVFRTDLGAQETYYGLYNSSTNPGGRDSAGWYSTDRTGGLVPIKPTTVTAVSGTATVAALGSVTFSGVTSVSLDGVFSSRFSKYMVLINVIANSTATGAFLRLRKAGTDNSATAYGQNGIYTSGGGTGNDNSIFSGFFLSPGGTDRSFNEVILANPFVNGYTSGTFRHIGTSGAGTTQNIRVNGIYHYVSDTFDGLTFYNNGGTSTGTIQIFGYNE